jgi:hypothetical protein
MDRERQLDLAETFRARHRAPHLLLLANAWDALSARIVEEAVSSRCTTKCVRIRASTISRRTSLWREQQDQRPMRQRRCGTWGLRALARC